MNGKWLTIKLTDAKSHKARDVELNEVLKSIVIEMKDRYHMLITAPIIPIIIGTFDVPFTLDILFSPCIVNK